MKIGVVSDIHGNYTALKAVVDALVEEKVDELIFLGDYIANGPSPNEVIELIGALDVKVCILGNTDGWLTEDISDWIPETDREKLIYKRLVYLREVFKDENRSFFDGLKDNEVFKIDGKKIMCVHGSPLGVRDGMYPEMGDDELAKRVVGVDADIVLSGHTHIGYLSNIDGVLIVNPGSVGLCDRDEDKRASYGVLEIHDGLVTFTVKKLVYDIEAEIERAEAGGFPDVDGYRESLMRF